MTDGPSDIRDSDPAVDHVTTAGGFGFRAGDVAVVTGAASGIGRATASLLARHGLVVVGWDLDEARLDDAEQEIAAAGGQCHTVVCDVTDAAAIDQAWTRSDTWGPVRYLVDNAGPPSSSNLTPAEGLTAAAASMAAVADRWIERTGGDCVAMTLTSSIAGTWAAGGTIDWYPMAKAAIAAYGRQLAVKHRGRPRVNIVQPGLVTTPRMVDFVASEAGRSLVARTPLGRAGEPAEIASTIAFLLSPLASYVNGATLVVDGGSVL